MAQLTGDSTDTAAVDVSPAQRVAAAVRPHLQEQLRSIFELYESRLLEWDTPLADCCNLRRARRDFIDGMAQNWVSRCESRTTEWTIGTAANATHTRTFLYLTQADLHVRQLYDERGQDIARLVTGWNAFVGDNVDAESCPVAPFFIVRLFFRFLPDLPVSLGMRDGIARIFLDQLPAMFQMILTAATTVWQRGARVHFAAVLLPDIPGSIESFGRPSGTSLALVCPPQTVTRVLDLAADVADLALKGEAAAVLELLEANRQTSLMPWLAEQLQSSEWPETARRSLLLLSGPLLAASTSEYFADVAHPARRVLEEWLHWAPGWVHAPDEFNAYGVAGQSVEETRLLAAAMVAADEDGHTLLDPGYWLHLLDYLVGLRKRSQQEGSISVTSARLAVQVLEVRAEVETLLQDRALAFAPLPEVVVDVLSEIWTALLMNIHWRDGSASDAWLSAVSVADELLSSVQPVLDRHARMQAMQRVSQLLRQLRKGFDAIQADRSVYAGYLERLERVHLALLQGNPAPEIEVDWPQPVVTPQEDEPFEVGQWLQEESDGRWRVIFSDSLCTVLTDPDSAGVVCCSTAGLHGQLFNGELTALPSPPGLLSLASVQKRG